MISANKRVWTLAALGLTAALVGAGCKTKSDGADTARVRLIDAVPASEGLNVSVNGSQVWRQAAFRSSSGYQNVAAGTYPLRLEGDGLGVTPAQSVSFAKGHTYTVLALGVGREARVRVLEDGLESPPPGRAGVRLLNASTKGIPMDLVVNSIVAAKGVRADGGGAALTLDGGAYDFQIAASNTADILAGPVTLRLEPGRSYTLVALGEADDGTLGLEAYPDTP